MNDKLDLVLINPGNRSQTYGELSELSGIEPPWWCGSIASFVRQYGYSVKIIDADAEGLTTEKTVERILQMQPLLVNIVVMGINPSASSTPKMDVVSDLVKTLKNASFSIKTIISGLHPSALPDLTLKEIPTDYVCQGEGFYTTLRLLETLKTGKDIKEAIPGLWYKKEEVIANGGYDRLIDINAIPFVAWDLLPMGRYRAHNWHCFENLAHRTPYASLYTSLGCPFNCNYCNVKALYGNKPGIRCRSVKKVIEEIDLLVRQYGLKNLKIADELFVLDKQRVNEICDLLIKKDYGLNIWAYARTDTVEKGLLKKMKKAGFHWLCYGIESASKTVREGVSKKLNQEMIEKAVEMTKGAGINVLGNFIFGLPDDNLETMQETLNLAKKLQCEYVNFYTAMAYPGSKLYEVSVKKSISLPKTWSGYAQLSEDSLPFPTRYLSSRQVLHFRDNAFAEYYTDPEYLKMMKNKFGEQAISHINEMLKYRPVRKYART